MVLAEGAQRGAPSKLRRIGDRRRSAGGVQEFERRAGADLLRVIS